MSFDHHDPEIQQMMERRALAQGAVVQLGHEVNFNAERMRAVAHNAAVIDSDERVELPARWRDLWADWNDDMLGFFKHLSAQLATTSVSWGYFAPVDPLVARIKALPDYSARFPQLWAPALTDVAVATPDPGALLAHVAATPGLADVYAPKSPPAELPHWYGINNHKPPPPVERAPCSRHGVALCRKCK